ncbi:hypothetical protein BJ165DRAFT_1355927, partial [Panaeolus papilionaceus]
INHFTNDNAYISTKWLLRLILSGEQKVRNLYWVQCISTTTFHILVILENGNYVCNCCMDSNAGIPCWHFFQVMLKVHMVKFKIGFIHPRWYKDNTIDPDTIHPVQLEHPLHAPEQRAQTSIVKVATSTSNPLEVRSQLSKSDTQTLDARTVYHEIQGPLKSTMSGIQTKADLDLLKEKLDDIR